MIKSILRNQRIRNLIPKRLKVFYAENRHWSCRVRHRSELQNIFHCCVHKTGSQWIRRILFDPLVYSNCGLQIYAYQARMANGERRPTNVRTFDTAFPESRIISPLYMSWQNFDSMPKAGGYRAFFVGRDPRDLAVSWLFSTRTAHPNMKNNQHRQKLQELDDRDGLKYAFSTLMENGEFEALASWNEAEADDSGIKVVRYEDLIGPNSREVFSHLFEHLQITLTDAEVGQLLERHSFKNLSGRKQGQEVRGSKMRKGVAGDWKNYFDAELEHAFRDTTGSLVERLGYEAQS